MTRVLPRNKIVVLFLLILFVTYIGAIDILAQNRQSIVLWDFNQADRPSSPAPWSNPIPANQGAGELSFTFADSGSRPVTSFAGSTEDLDGFSVSAAGGSFAPQGEKENGEHFMFFIDSRGYSDLIISYATRRTSTGFSSHNWQISTDEGITWEEVELIDDIPSPANSAMELRSFELDAKYTGQAILMIRCIIDGATNDSGNNRFDNIRVSGFLETVDLSLSASTINFDDATPLGQFSGVKSFVIESFESEASLVLNATAGFQIALEEGGTFSQILEIDPSQHDTDTEIFVRYQAPEAAASGVVTGSISFNLDLAASVQLTALVEGDLFSLPYSETFNNPDLFTLPNWQRFQEVGQQNWSITTDNRRSDSPASAVINGFSDGPQDNRNWLISPIVDISSVEDGFLLARFESRSFFAEGTPLLRVFASVDYDRANAPTNETYTWTELSASFPMETGQWQSTGDIDLSQFIGESQISFAIVYESSTVTNGAPEWMVDNFEITTSQDIPAPIIETNNWSLEDYHFGILEPSEASDVRDMRLTVSNLNSNLTLSGDPGIELSISSNEFSPVLTLSPSDIPSSGDLTVRTRMVADQDESILAQAGSITITSDNQEDKRFGYYNHTTIGKDKTFDVVTWNIEWFGDPANATTPNVDTQRRRVRQMIEELDADIYAFQEITSIPQWNLLLLELEDYDGVLSPAFSRPAGDFSSAQKLAFMWKKSTVDTIQTKVLMENVNRDDMVGFPEGPNRSTFWSSGRYPFAMDITTTINGVKRDLMMINIHARSNGGGESASLPRYQLRRYDVEVLYDSIAEYYSDKSIMIIGDYNDDILRTVADVSAPTVPDSGESSYIKYISDSANYLGVSMPMSKAGMRSFVTRESVIDHIMINKHLFDDHILGAERVVIPYRTIPDYNTTTSDHFPVEARFLLTGEEIITSVEVPENRKVLYPNPTRGIIRLKDFGSIQKIQVLSISGQLVKSFDGNQSEIDLSNLRSGTYLVEVYSEDAKEVKRVILK
ncbi:MAG: T9SS type A sorting domain-containing protein [Cyclobacteriaceae bacterium]|nr:T9SS type A sorting domain-containing protein [Cyclobacteriaceae bacterium]MCH8517540.1 T9SS type A sorting domain-containing protein [Cyclobacteriaceae bacterium]